MREQNRDLLIRNYIAYGSDDEQKIKLKKTARNMRSAANIAKSIVFNSDKKYKHQLFIGDSKTPLGTYDLTISEAGVKNKNYEAKLFNSTDDTYRLRRLKLTKEAYAELKADIDKEYYRLRDEVQEKLKKKVDNNT